MKPVFALLFSLMAASTVLAASNNNYVFKVYNLCNNGKISGALVQVGESQCITDSNGQCTLSLNKGYGKLNISKSGYNSSSSGDDMLFFVPTSHGDNYEPLIPNGGCNKKKQKRPYSSDFAFGFTGISTSPVAIFERYAIRVLDRCNNDIAVGAEVYVNGEKVGTTDKEGYCRFNLNIGKNPNVKLVITHPDYETVQDDQHPLALISVIRPNPKGQKC